MIPTERTFYIFKNLNNQSIYLVKEKFQPEPSQSKLNNNNKTLTEKRLTNISKLQIEFYKIIGFLCSETRYGNVFKKEEDVYYVENLFIEYMKNPIYYQYLLKFKELGKYIYYHIVDVFTLSTLFCRKEGIPNIEDIAIGFLFHDIGKLYTPVHLLRKEGNLTKKEYHVLQKQLKKGYDLLKQIGLEKVIYLANSQHEHITGSGYREELEDEELPKEVQILKIIDRYSVITLRRSYEEVVTVSDAIDTLYNESHLYNKELLNSFTDFIGIYPENAVVSLK